MLKARFVELMECLPVQKVPEPTQWTYELKLDGYRLEVLKSKGKVTLYSRRGNDLTTRFDYIADALSSLPDETVIDGELVGPDASRVIQALAFVEADHDRIYSEISRHVPADDELLSQVDSSLPPHSGSFAGLIHAVRSLRDHAFEAMASHEIEHLWGRLCRKPAKDRRDR